MNLVHLVAMLTELLERMAEHACECRGRGDKRPLELECHAPDCAYVAIVRGPKP